MEARGTHEAGGSHGAHIALGRQGAEDRKEWRPRPLCNEEEDDGDIIVLVRRLVAMRAHTKPQEAKDKAQDNREHPFGRSELDAADLPQLAAEKGTNGNEEGGGRVYTQSLGAFD